MSVSDQQAVSVTVDQNPHLPAGVGTVEAIVTIGGRKPGVNADELTLRVWIPAGARTTFVKQVAPTLDDLTDRAARSGNHLSEYVIPNWGNELDLHIRIDVEPADVGREKLAARVSAVVASEIVGEGLIRAIWTDDTTLSAPMSPRLAHYTGQSELAQAIRDGLTARANGDAAEATARLTRALTLAERSGDRGTADLLRRVVEVDQRTGTMRLRPEISTADGAALEARSTRTMRVRKDSQ